MITGRLTPGLIRGLQSVKPTTMKLLRPLQEKKFLVSNNGGIVQVLQHQQGTKHISLESASKQQPRLFCAGGSVAMEHTHNRFTAFLEYVRDHPGEQVPER